MSIHKRAGRYCQIRKGKTFWWWRRLEPDGSSYLYFEEVDNCSSGGVLKHASSDEGWSHANDHPELAMGSAGDFWPSLATDPGEGFE